MTIGPDLKETFQEVGVAYTILRDAGNISGEYSPVKLNRQATKPFIREFFLESSSSYDTASIAGDVIRFNATDNHYMIMNKTATIFENEVINHECVLYKCNVVSGEIQRASGEVWSTQTYHKVPSWPTVKTLCKALQTESLFGYSLETDQELGLLGLREDELYIPSSYGIQINDRWQPASGEYYMVAAVRPRRFQSVDVAIIKEDTR